MESIGQRLRARRKTLGLSIQEVARQINLPESTYRGWENGVTIQGEPYRAIARVLGTSLLELMYGERPQLPTLLENLKRVRLALSQVEEQLKEYYEG
jgi:transcriptional regulator with XRE-family HTH domain